MLASRRPARTAGTAWSGTASHDGRDARPVQCRPQPCAGQRSYSHGQSGLSRASCRHGGGRSPSSSRSCAA